jgi:hypothetical protein
VLSMVTTKEELITTEEHKMHSYQLTRSPRWIS